MAKSFTFRFIGDASSFTRATKQAGDSVATMESRIDGSIKGIGNKFAGLGTLAVAGVGLAADKLVDFGMSSFDMAKDTGEAASKVKTVFGPAGASVEQFAKDAAKNLGMSQLEALNATGTFGNMFVQLGTGQDQAAGLSTELTTLASDFASFHNASRPEVVEAMTAAFRGEYDALQKYVPTINAAAVEQKALEMTGKGNAKELTNQEKAMAAYRLMVEGAGPALGDFARTADSAANKQAALNAQFNNAKTSFGEALMPVLTAAMTAATPLIENLTKILTPLIPVVTPIIGLLTDMAVTLGNALTPVLQAIGPPLAQLIEAFKPLANELGRLFVETMTALAPVFASLLQALVPVAQKMTDALVPVIRDDIIPNLPKMTDAVLKVTDAFLANIDAIVPLIPQLADLLAKMTPGMVETFALAMTATAESLRIVNPLLEILVDLLNKIPTDVLSSAVAPLTTLIGTVSGRAIGGPVHSGRPYVVGERGPELFVPHGGGEIIPNGRMPSMGAEPATMDVTLMLDGQVLTKVTLDQMRREAYAGFG